MSNLAGFDVIAEIHIETVIDFVNQSPLTNPADNSEIYLLGGPFSVDLPLNLGSLGIVTARLILDPTLEPVVHQSAVNLIISLSVSSGQIAGRLFGAVSGEATVSIQLAFMLPSSQGAPAPGTPPKPQVPVLVLNGVAPKVVLDAPSQSLADAAFGTGGAALFTSALELALTAFLAKKGTIDLPGVGFTVLNGLDSSDPQQLSAVPTVAWIDRSTLGVFGYYRAAGQGGNVADKTNSDIQQDHEEYFYDQPGSIRVLPGRRIGLLLSPEAFEMVLACPAVRNSVVRGLVEQREHSKWVARIREQDGAAILADMTRANFFTHLLEEVADHPHDSIQDQIAKAKADVQKDADRAIDGAASAEENAWLDSTAPDGRGCETTGGQQAIDGAMPLPCGNGSVEAKRLAVDVPGAQGDLVVILNRLGVSLGDGRIAVHGEVHASLEYITGDLDASLACDVDILVSVTESGVLTSAIDVKDAVPEVGATGLTGDLLALLKSLLSIGGDWGAVMTLLSMACQVELQRTINSPIGQSRPVLMSLGSFPTRLADIKIASQSLLLLGLVCRAPRWNTFSPGVVVDASIDARVRSNQPPVYGNLNLPATEWGCPAVEFETVRTFWDSTVTVHARLRDAPLPITVLGWQVELGNFSVNSFSPGARMIDPRPTWSGESFEIIAGQMILKGKVHHPNPPLTLISLPIALGSLQQAEVSVEVSGDPDKGWQIQFRGQDGNFYVRFSIDLSDGAGSQWHGETFVEILGDQLELPPGYAQYQSDCDARYRKYMRLKLAGMGLVAMGQVEPGQPVMNGETREAVAVRTLFEAGGPSVLGQVIAANKRFGPRVLGLMGRVRPLTNTQNLVRKSAKGAD